EYACYFAVIYSVIGPAVGLEIPNLAGGIFLVVGAWSIRQVLPWAKIVYRPIALLLAFAISFFFVQILIHGESITQGNVRVFIPWILGLFIVYPLCSRPGFSFRFPLVLFVIGTATLPFLTFSQSTVDMAS